MAPAASGNILRIDIGCHGKSIFVQCADGGYTYQNLPPQKPIIDFDTTYLNLAVFCLHIEQSKTKNALGTLGMFKVSRMFNLLLTLIYFEFILINSLSIKNKIYRIYRSILNILDRNRKTPRYSREKSCSRCHFHLEHTLNIFITAFRRIYAH